MERYRITLLVECDVTLEVESNDPATAVEEAQAAFLRNPIAYLVARSTNHAVIGGRGRPSRPSDQPLPGSK